MPRTRDRRIRLVVFDLGDTLMCSEDDQRAFNRQPGEMLDENAMVEAPGRVVRLFPGVRELFLELASRGTYVSVASLNVPWAYKWLGPGYFDLETSHLHFPITEAGDSWDDTKGYWVEKIINWFNRYVVPGDPILPENVLFVDDLARCHRAVTRVVPGVTCAFPTPHVEGGMLSLLELVDELESASG